MTGAARITCPKCRANNFPGKTNCWQCGASLPPPEALAGSQQAVPYQTPAVWNPPPSPLRRRPALFIVVPLIMLVVIGVGVFAFGRSHAAKTDSALSDKQAELNALRDKLMRDRVPGSQNGSTQEIDPDIAAARATMKRLEQEHGLTEPPADSSGDVHLKTGGTISQEQWERAAQSLRR